MIDEAAIRARCDKATPGPWIYNGNEIVTQDNPSVGIAGALTDGDNTFIAHARQDIPALLDEVDRQWYLLLGVMHSVDKWFDVVPDDNEAHRAAMAREIALRAIEVARRNRPTWISVEDRLPEDNVNVLVYCGDIGFGAYVDTGNRYGGRWWSTTEDNITHWMPLPEPPGEGKTDD